MVDARAHGNVFLVATAPSTRIHKQHKTHLASAIPTSQTTIAFQQRATVLSIPRVCQQR